MPLRAIKLFYTTAFYPAFHRGGLRGPAEVAFHAAWEGVASLKCGFQPPRAANLNSLSRRLNCRARELVNLYYTMWKPPLREAFAPRIALSFFLPCFREFLRRRLKASLTFIVVTGGIRTLFECLLCSVRSFTGLYSLWIALFGLVYYPVAFDESSAP